MNNTNDLSTSEQLDRLSAFLDGELSESELEAVLDDLDGPCCAQLKSYQIIGDVMRDSSLAISTSDLFSVRLAKALEAEPAHSLEDVHEEELQATGTYGVASSVATNTLSTQTAQVHTMPRKPKARLAFVAGGVAAAFATIVTYSVFQGSDIQPSVDSAVPVLASTETQTVTPDEAPVLVASHINQTNQASQANNAATVDSAQSFSRAPTVAVRAAAPSSRVSTEERRRTYPEYLRSHSDMSAHTPFMQVNYQGLGVGQ